MRAMLLLVGVLVPIAVSSGQMVSAHVVVGAPKWSTQFSGVTERLDGWSVGGAVELEKGRLGLSASGMRGRLAPPDPGSQLNTDVGELSFEGRYDVTSWFGCELRYAARAFSSSAGYQRWDMVGVGATASRELGTPAVYGYAQLLYFPVVDVSNQENPSFALGSDVGIAVAPSRLSLAVTLNYRIERFTFPEAVARSEQFESLRLSLAVRARRHAGRWTLGGGGQ